MWHAYASIAGGTAGRRVIAVSAHLEVTRRVFLQGIGALAVQVSIARPGAAQSALPRSLAANPNLDTWLRVNADETVSMWTGKAELGQGIRTALAQIAAEELDLAFERIRVEPVDTSRSPSEGRTTGSVSIERSGAAIRMAAAEARQLLLQNAAARLNVSAARLSVSDGQVLVDGRGGGLSYWELLSDAGFDTRVTASVAPKNPDLHDIVGTSRQRIDLPAKFFGEPAYVHDLRMPGMLHARIVRPRADSARLTAVNTDLIRQMEGVVAIVNDGSFLAVLAEREEQAIAAADALRENASWEPFQELPDENRLPQLMRELQGFDPEVIFDRSESGAEPGAESGAGYGAEVGAEVGMESGAEAGLNGIRQFSAEYSRPYIAHASMAPSAAVALWDGAHLTVWSHTQGAFELRGAIATVLDLPESQITCIHVEGAGCYGQNGADDAGLDAAMIARAIEGRPVRLVWSREDEFRREPYGSATIVRISAGLDAADRVVDWDYHHWSCTHSTRPAGGTSAANLLASQEKSRPLPDSARYQVRQPHSGGDRNAVALYAFPQQRVTRHFVSEQPLRVSALRGLGAHANVFAIESFMDELAVEAGGDPVDFRIQHLEDSRARAVLRVARELAGNRDSADSEYASGRGVAFARYKNTSAYFAVVMDVEVNLETGAVRVIRAHAAVDVGQVINPDGVRNQIEGGIVQATSWTLKESVRFSTSGVESVDWNSYPILRFEDVPEVAVSIIDRPELPSTGAGEAAQGPTSAAIANAVADATGVRVRDLPLRPERVLAALGSATTAG